MAQVDSPKRPSGSYRKPRPDIYTVLLAIALVAILAAILLLYFELDMYGFQHKGGPMVRLERSAPAAVAPDSWSQIADYRARNDCSAHVWECAIHNPQSPI